MAIEGAMPVWIIRWWEDGKPYKGLGKQHSTGTGTTGAVAVTITTGIGQCLPLLVTMHVRTLTEKRVHCHNHVMVARRRNIQVDFITTGHSAGHRLATEDQNQAQQ